MLALNPNCILRRNNFLHKVTSERTQSDGSARVKGEHFPEKNGACFDKTECGNTARAFARRDIATESALVQIEVPNLPTSFLTLPSKTIITRPMMLWLDGHGDRDVDKAACVPWPPKERREDETEAIYPGVARVVTVGSTSLRWF